MMLSPVPAAAAAAPPEGATKKKKHRLGVRRRMPFPRNKQGKKKTLLGEGKYSYMGCFCMHLRLF